MNKATVRISKSAQNIAKGLDRAIEDVAGEHLGFTLIVYTEERATYISNVDRGEATREIKKLLECWDQGMPDIKAHEIS